MVFFWFLIPFLVLMVLTRRRYQREEEDSGDSHDDHDPQYEGNEGFELEEEEEDNEEGQKNDKDALRPLWACVTKLEDGRGGGTTKFLFPHNCHKGKPYTGSYTCAVLRGSAPPPPPLEPAPELRSQGERSGSVLPGALPERSPSGAFLGSAIPLKILRSLVFEGALRERPGSVRSLDAP
jgi:hypothetical protein